MSSFSQEQISNVRALLDAVRSDGTLELLKAVLSTETAVGDGDQSEFEVLSSPLASGMRMRCQQAPLWFPGRFASYEAASSAAQRCLLQGIPGQRPSHGLDVDVGMGPPNYGGGQVRQGGIDLPGAEYQHR